MEPVSKELFDRCLKASLQQFNLTCLKKEQRDCVEQLVLSRQDVFAVLPTGYGKSIIYQILPTLLSRISTECNNTSTNNATVIVVSPLEYIRKQQVDRLQKLGIAAATLERFNDGTHIPQIIYGSAENWLSNKWKTQLQQMPWIKALVVDEVRTVETW